MESVNENEQITNSPIVSEIPAPPDTVVQKSTALKGHEFAKNMMTRKTLGSHFYDNWTFVYHEDSRCIGSTDGQVKHLRASQVDSTISLQVHNDGDSWACPKTEPNTFDLSFNLRERSLNWDRFEVQHYSDEAHTADIAGAGESDYIRLHYNQDDLIVKLEYRSEDPG